MKDIKDDTNRWRDIPCSWIGRINIVKMTLLPKAIYRFNAIPMKIPTAFVLKKLKSHSSIHSKLQVALNSQNTILKKKNKARGLILPNFKTDYKAPVIKTDRPTDQWNRNKPIHLLPTDS